LRFFSTSCIAGGRIRPCMGRQHVSACTFLAPCFAQSAACNAAPPGPRCSGSGSSVGDNAIVWRQTSVSRLLRATYALHSTQTLLPAASLRLIGLDAQLDNCPCRTCACFAGPKPFFACTNTARLKGRMPGIPSAAMPRRGPSTQIWLIFETVTAN
jgi:hypothetical protein